MENDFKFSILLSLFIHLIVFSLLYIHSKQTVFVTLPIELLFYGQVSAPSTAPQIGESKEIISKKKEEIVIPKTKKESKKQLKETKKDKGKEKQKEKETKAPPSAETKPVSGASGDSTSNSLIQQGQISFDTAKFPYAYYTNIIIKKIGRYWQWSTDYGQLKSVLYFKIMRDGTISEVEVKTASGDDSFDQQAVRAVKLSSPFPPLPVGFEGNELGIYFEFSFK